MWILWSESNSVCRRKRSEAILVVGLLLHLKFCCLVCGKRNVLNEFRNYGIAIPRIYNRDRTLNVTVTEGTDLPNGIFVEIYAFQQLFTLQLIQNIYLFGTNYTEKSIKDGEEIYNNSKNDAHCYYSGHLIGQPSLTAAVSTCKGIWGYFTTESDGYHLEPWEWSSSGQHYIFRDSDYYGLNLTCGYKGRNGRVLRAASEAVETAARGSWSWTHDNRSKVVELYVVNDYFQFADLRKDVSKVFRRTKDIVNIVNSLYRPLNIHVLLVGIEIWARDNKIDVTASADVTLSNFLEYRRYKINPKHRNDNTQMLTSRVFSDNVVGTSDTMNMCTSQFSAGVVTDYITLVGPVAFAMAHQIGHNFGLSHDTALCGCKGDRCIMATSCGGPKFRSDWSECSKQQFADAFHQGMDYCLYDASLIAFGKAVCGNAIVEDGEDCDCGLPEDCNNYCCNAASCKLVSNATCARGECCDLSTCQVKAAATECRPAKGDCDLSEYCDGISNHCPSDVFLADSRQCNNNGVKSYCYQGKCHTHNSQCQFLWGVTGRASHHLCFERFNIHGNSSGNCGYSWVNGRPMFRKCEPQDTLCGMLHCEHLNEKLMFWKEGLAYHLPEASLMLNGTRLECKGAILDVGLHVPDPGLVPDGAACGDGKMCFEQRCQDVSTAFPSACPDCHSHGVCNSIGQCHCDKGYAPPYCEKAGTGGSVQSGPIQIYVAEEDNSHLIVGLCVFFLLILPLLILLAFCVFRYRKTIKDFWIKRKPEKYHSVESVHICTTDSFEAAVPVTETIEVKPQADDSVPQAIVPLRPPQTETMTLPVRRPHAASSRPLSVVIRPNPPSRNAMPKRASSIAAQDISSPQFVSSTNINLDSTLPLSKIRRGEFQGLKQTSNVEPGSDVTHGPSDLQFRTLPNPPSKSRGVSLNTSQDRNTLLNPSSPPPPPPSQPRLHQTSAAELAFARLNKPSDSLVKELELEENLYEEISSQPVCPKVPPPNPPTSQQKAVCIESGKNRTVQESRVGTGPISAHQSKVAASLKSDADQTGSRKPKTRSTSVNDNNDKGNGETRSGANEQTNKVGKKTRQSSVRSSQRSPASMASGMSSANDSVNVKQSRAPREPRDRTQK